MSRQTIKRILVTLGLTAGIITTIAAHASALAGANHSEPTHRTR